MSYNTLETSRESGAPITLYLFQYGPNPGDYTAITDSETAISYGAHTYAPVPIDREAISVSGTLDKAPLNVTTSRGVEQLMSLFSGWPPAATVLLTVFEGHVGDTEFITVWAGRVTGLGRDGSVGTFTAEPVVTSLARIGLRRNWSRGCPHVLYEQGDGLCNANRAAGTITTTVDLVSSSGPIVQLNPGWQGSRQIGTFTNGYARWVTSGRTYIRGIITPNATSIKLNGKIQALSPGQSIELTIGCKQNMESCRDDHNNIHNYGGQDWIPLENPIGIKSIFN